MANYFGAVAEFESAADIYKAAEKTTTAGYTRVDSHSPFAIHGMEKVLRHPPSHVGWICVVAGIAGIVLAQLMMWWMNGVDYQYVVAGKRAYDWPTTIPITFECMVLLSAFGAVFGMFGLNKLPRLNHPLFRHKTFHRASDDRFYLSVEASDPKFDQTKIVEFLESIGGKNVELLEEED
jgi:hypothetical protein